MTDERFKEHLRRQLGFIERSASAFDAGHIEEGARIATSARILIHDTKQQTSLRSRLSARNVALLSTSGRAPQLVKGRTTYFEGLLGFSTKGLTPKLRHTGTEGFMPVEDWWQQIVLIEKNAIFRRRDLVLHAADKDGGAHVDRSLTPEYEALTKGLWHHAPKGGSPSIVSEHQFLSLRQVAFELLASPALLALAMAAVPNTALPPLRAVKTAS